MKPAQTGDTVMKLPSIGVATAACCWLLSGILPAQAISGALADAAGLPDGEFRYHQDDTKVR